MKSDAPGPGGATRRPNLDPYRWLALIALLVGLFLRSASLAWLSRGLNYDEAWYAVNAADLLQHPRLTPFFPENFGRESGWMYWMSLFMTLLGPNRFAARITAVFTGVLTLAALHRLGREVFGPAAGAFWGTAALAVLYWHVHLSQQVLRGNFFIWISTLAGAGLLRAYRLNTRTAWIAGGLGLGILAYTYLASFALIAYLAALLAGVLLVEPQRRVGALTALAVAGVIMMPLALYFVAAPTSLLHRPGDIAIPGAAGLLENLGRWANAWFGTGDPDTRFNLPGRPILDPTTGALGALGLLGVFRLARSRRHIAFLAGWSVVALTPSLAAEPAPHFLRAAGLIAPVALLIGGGAALASAVLMRLSLRNWMALLPALLLVPVGYATYRDFHLEWVNRAETSLMLERPLNDGFDYFRSHPQPETPAYISPFGFDHPVYLFRRGELTPRPVGAFASAQCLVLPERPADYFSMSLFEDLPGALSEWADITPLDNDPGPQPRYRIFRATPRPEWLRAVSRPQAQFGGVFDVYALHLPPMAASPGDTLTVTLGVRAQSPAEASYSLFVHLYGDPTPYEGGRLWSQVDHQLCESHPAPVWRAEEVIIQAFDLVIPVDTPLGKYSLAVGLYPYPQGARLPVTMPAATDRDYALLSDVVIGPSKP